MPSHTGGTCCFSTQLLTGCCDCCSVQTTDVWRDIEALKEIVTEPRESGRAFEASIATYTRAVEGGKGALLMAVCRGKVIEAKDPGPECTYRIVCFTCGLHGMRVYPPWLNP